MRVLVDTNVFISYLLTSERRGTVHALFEALFDERFTLLLPALLLDEIVVTVSQRPHLRRRIPLESLETVVALLKEIGERVPEIEGVIPPVTRDPKDDYLIAYAVVAEADYLVTGDRDLLEIDTILGVQIISPTEFVALL